MSGSRAEKREASVEHVERQRLGQATASDILAIMA